MLFSILNFKDDGFDDNEDDGDDSNEEGGDDNSEEGESEKHTLQHLHVLHSGMLHTATM